MAIRTVAFGSFAFAALVTSMPAWAQSAPSLPAAQSGDPAPSPAPLPPGAAPASTTQAPSQPDAIEPAKSPVRYAPMPAAAIDEEGARARAVLDALAVREHSMRVVGSYGALVGGAAVAGLGIAAESRYPRTFSPAFWILSGSLVVNGVAGLLTRGPLESLADRAGGQSDAALREGWAAAARSAERQRQIGGWISVGLGAGTLATGAALALGATSMEDKARTGWSGGLLVAGGIMSGTGVATLLIKTETEFGYRAAYGSDPPPLTVGIAPLPGGGAVSLAGTF